MCTGESSAAVTCSFPLKGKGKKKGIAKSKGAEEGPVASDRAEVGGKQSFKSLHSLDVFAGCGGQYTSAK